MELSKNLSKEEIKKVSERISNTMYLKEIFDALSLVALIVNEYNQIVYFNDKIMETIGIDNSDEVFGLRPGDLFSCVNVPKGKYGCGTSDGCQLCGLFNAILESQLENRKVKKECRISREKNKEFNSIDFEVSAMPIKLNEEKFTIVSLEDISDKKRKEVLERVFFHDIMNKAGSINGFIDYLNQNYDESEVKEILPLLGESSSQLMKQILAQRDLMLAENKKLELDKKAVDVGKIVQKLAKHYYNMSEFKEFYIETDIQVTNLIVETDDTLYERIIENMLKNGLEAAYKKKRVKIGCYVEGNEIITYVSNKVYIPKDVQLQIFQRSFSTKGANRGIGTYSMKVLGENYLKGKVWFESIEEKGTTFYYSLPYMRGEEDGKNT